MTNSDRSQDNDKAYDRSAWRNLGHKAFDDPTLFDLDDIEWWHQDDADD